MRQPNSKSLKIIREDIQENGLRMHVLYFFTNYLINFIYYNLGFYLISRSFYITYMI